MFLISLALSSLGCSHAEETVVEPAATSKNNSLKLLILGVDGMAPAIVNKQLAAGKMPNLAHLMDNGSTVSITARGKLNSPLIWTTIATGFPPEVHGITDFTINDIPVNSSFRKVPALWNILHQNKIKTATLGWWASWPAEQDGGTIISDLAYWGDSPQKVFPEQVIDTKKYDIGRYRSNLEFLPRFTQYPYLPDFRNKLKKNEWPYRLNGLLEDRLVTIYYRDQIYTDIAIELLQKEKPQVLNLYLRGIDFVQHAFWQFMEPEPFRKAGWDIDPTEVSQLQNIIPEYYAYIDELMGKILPYCDKDTLVFVISDHGFEAGPQLKYTKPELSLSVEHDESTLFVMSGHEIVKQKKSDKEFDHVDFLPTVLYALGLPIAKDFAGQPATAYFSDHFQDGNPAKYCATYNKQKTIEKEKATSKQDDKIIKDLRSLGYIK